MGGTNDIAIMHIQEAGMSDLAGTCGLEVQCDFDAYLHLNQTPDNIKV